MRRLLLVIAATALGNGPAFCDRDLPPAQEFSDPSPQTSVYFSPKVTTAGVARLGASLNRPVLATRCLPANPCALPTPEAGRAGPAGGR